MSDLIRREDAIREIVKRSATDFMDVEAIATVIHIVNKMPSVEVPRWIPCSERLPDKGLRVLMQLDNAWQIVGWYDKEDAQWYALPYEEPIDEFTYAKVIAWMPLPSPYEPQESEESE